MLVFSKKKYDDAKLIIKCRVLCLLDELIVFIFNIFTSLIGQGLGYFLELGPIGFLEIKPNVLIMTENASNSLPLVRLD